MRIILLGFCLLSLQGCLTVRPKRDAADSSAQACVTELNLEVEKIMKINGEDYTPEGDEDYARYTECYWKRMGYVDDFGDFIADNLKKMIVESIKIDAHTKKSMHKIADLILDQCRHSHGPTIGKKAIRMENCITKYYKVFLRKYSEVESNVVNRNS